METEEKTKIGQEIVKQLLLTDCLDDKEYWNHIRKIESLSKEEKILSEHCFLLSMITTWLYARWCIKNNKPIDLINTIQ